MAAMNKVAASSMLIPEACCCCCLFAAGILKFWRRLDIENFSTDTNTIGFFVSNVCLHI